MKPLKTAKIIITYLALVFALAIVFTSCSTLRREGSTSPCYSSKKMVGYSFGGWAKGRAKH